MYSLKFTGILLLVLFIPLLLRFYDYEPYPAVLFPSGAGVLKLKSDKTVEMQSKMLLGKKASGEWGEIDSKAFLQPASLPNLLPFISINFGLDDTKPKRKRHSKYQFIKDILNFDRPPLSEAGGDALRKWLNARLIQQGYIPNQIKVLTYTRIISTETGTVINKKVQDEKVVSFTK